MSDLVDRAARAFGEAIERGRRKMLADAFADPDPDKRAEVARGLRQKLAHHEAALQPETWARLMAALDGAAATGDTEPLEAAIAAADAERKRPNPVD